MADVARYAGVSTAVVSYVVNDGPRRVAPATAARVRSAIEVLNYRPNVNARALRIGTTHMLGLVLPDLTNPLFVEYARAVEGQATARGYRLLVGNSSDDWAIERRVVDDLIGRHVDGLILSTMLAAGEFRMTSQRRPPTVLINVSSPFAGHPAIGTAARDGARTGVEHLLCGHGLRNVALIIGESTEAVPEPREQGFADALRALDLPPGPVVRTAFSRPGGYAAMQQILQWTTRPDGIFVAADQQAVGVLRAVHEAGLRCPDDIAVVSYDGTIESGYTWPALTVVRQPVQQMAEAAVTMVLDGSASDSSYRQFATDLVLRQSCGCA